MWTPCVIDILQNIPIFCRYPVYLIFCNIFLYSVDTLCIWYSAICSFILTLCFFIFCNIFLYSVDTLCIWYSAIYSFILLTPCVFDILQYIPLFCGHSVYLIFCNIVLYSVDTLCIRYSAIYSFILWTRCAFNILQYIPLFCGHSVFFDILQYIPLFCGHPVYLIFCNILLYSVDTLCVWYSAIYSFNL